MASMWQKTLFYLGLVDEDEAQPHESPARAYAEQPQQDPGYGYAELLADWSCFEGATGAYPGSPVIASVSGRYLNSRVFVEFVKLSNFVIATENMAPTPT